jgi:acyl-CoA thioesterase-2
MEASFQRREQGLAHAVRMPDAPDPEGLDDVHALVERFRAFLPEQVESWLNRRSALDMRVVAPDDVFLPERRAAGQRIWFRVRGALPDDPGVHNALLAYLSDMTLINTALLVHGLTIFDPKIQVASLDHALWIHEALRVDQWLLYAQQSPWAGGARALTRGEIFTREGRLVASVSQEGLVRLRDAARS